MEIDQIVKELQFKAVRSSGAGGQNVNKVSSKVVLTFDLKQSQALTEEEKIVLENKLANRLTSEQLLILHCDEYRSQLKNKEVVVKKFLKVIENGLKIPKQRKETKIPRAVKEKRLQEKKSTASIKENRKKPNF